MDSASKLITEEINRLSPQIEKTIKIKLSGFLEDPKVLKWMEINGVNKRNNPIQTISNLAAFSLILKLVIAKSICEVHGIPFPSSLKTSSIMPFFTKVNNVVGFKILPTSLLDDLIQLLPSLKESTIKNVHTIFETLRENREQLSEVYDVIMSQEEKRKMGQFWTPDYIADFMVAWALRSRNDRLFEPGTGPATFLLKGIKRFEELGQEKKYMSKNLFGIELGFVPYLMGIANLLACLPTTKVNVIHGDFLEIQPKNNRSKGATLDVFLSTKSPLFDAIVFNPPYTRHHLLPLSYKEKLVSNFKQQFGVKISRLSSLFVYFIFHALNFWKEGGRMAVITPTIVFESRTSETLKKFLIKKVKIHAIISFSDENNVFEGVDTAACITLLENSSPDNGKVALIELEKWPGKEQLLRVLGNSEEGKYDWGVVKRTSTSELAPSKNWVTLIKSDKFTKNPKFVPLKDIAYIVRGIATGANDFFALTDQEVEEEGVEQSFLRPVITRTRYAQGFIFTDDDFKQLGEKNKKRWLLYLDGELKEMKERNIAKYIEKGEKAGISKRSLVQTRKRWYAMEQREIPPIIYTYLTRKRSRFILNNAEALALNVFLLIYPIPSIVKDEKTLKAFLAILNSGIVKKNIRQVGRSYGGDTIKVEPRQLDEALVIDPRKLTFNQINRLGQLFDLLCEKSKKPDEEHVKRKIDAFLFECIS